MILNNINSQIQISICIVNNLLPLAPSVLHFSNPWFLQYSLGLSIFFVKSLVLDFSSYMT